MKYRIYRIFIKGRSATRVNIATNNIEQIRNEISILHNVHLNKIKFSYETNESDEH